MMVANNDVNLLTQTTPQQAVMDIDVSKYLHFVMSFKNVQIQANNNINTWTASYYPTFSNKIE